jgi:hypothetical protein
MARVCKFIAKSCPTTKVTFGDHSQVTTGLGPRVAMRSRRTWLVPGPGVARMARFGVRSGSVGFAHTTGNDGTKRV